MPYARVDLGAAACEADSAQTKRNVKESYTGMLNKNCKKLVKYKYLHQKEDEMYIIIMYYQIII